MKNIVGFSTFQNSEEKEMLSVHYTDDDNFPDFEGLSVGTIIIPMDFVEIKTFDGVIHLGDTINVVPQISRKGKLYKTVSIGD